MKLKGSDCLVGVCLPVQRVEEFGKDVEVSSWQ